MTPERAAKIKEVEENRQKDLAIVLENVDDPFNVAAVLRTCDSVGVPNVYVVSYGNKKDYNFRNKASASAIKWLNVMSYESLDECMAVVMAKYAHILGTHLSNDAKTPYETDFTAPTAILFGNEHDGLSNEAMAYCTGNVVIPQVGMIQSLNISVACAVILYEAFRQRWK